MRLEVDAGLIKGAGFEMRGRYPVLSAHLIGERVVVIYDWMAFPQQEPARNLFCYDKGGTLLWRAGDIGFGAVDAYTNVISEAPLWVGNFASFNCRINEASGEVLERVFTK